MNLSASKLIRSALATAILIQVAGGAVVCGQLPRKFDAFEDLRTSDLKARLDLFATELNQESGAQGYIFGYHSERTPKGTFLRALHGYRDYLVNSRAVSPDRIGVIDAGIRNPELTELWIVPIGGTPPRSATNSSLASEAAVQFDRITVGPGCVGEYTLVLEEPENSFEIFAAALRLNSERKGYVVIHPSTQLPMSKARQLASSTKQALTQQYGIPAKRIVTRISSERRCLEINYWLVPPNVSVPAGSHPEVVFQSPLLDEAEQMNYWVRRVEFSGNRYTRDKVLRQRILLQEGDIFKRAILRRSLELLSRSRIIKPVGMGDVEVYLNREEKVIDLTINFIERRRINFERR